MTDLLQSWHEKHVAFVKRFINVRINIKLSQ